MKPRTLHRIFRLAQAVLFLWPAAAYSSVPRPVVLRTDGHHPVTQFVGDLRYLPKSARKLVGLDAAGMRRLYETGPKTFWKSLRAALAMWSMKRSESHRALALRACRAVLDDTSIEDLCALVSERGAADKNNLKMRDTCYLFAIEHYLTSDRRSAENAAALLARFAEQIPKWPLYGRDGKAYHQDDRSYLRRWDANGLWGVWIYSDCVTAARLAYAYDLIYSSGAMQRAGSLKRIEAMLRRHVDLSFRYGVVFSNMDGVQMRGILLLAAILGEPEWVHLCVRWLRDIYKTSFYADGWWREGTPSYHKQIHHSLSRINAQWLQGYSDPPGFVSKLDGTRFDRLNILNQMRRPFARADAALAAVQQPNRICQVIHDTSFPQRVWWAPAMKEARSYLFGCMGHAILGAGKADGDMAQASLHFGGTHGHEHYDCLNLILFAKGKELLSETRYRPRDATNSTREWHTMTAGHITVVVDEKNQRNRFSRTPPSDKLLAPLKPQTQDAAPAWRWYGRAHGVAMNDGMLRLFNPKFDKVQVAEADGRRCYAPAMDEYRRAIALVRISPTDAYVVDVFRVRGGRVHDYMLHGCLEEPYHLALSVPLPQRLPGTLHKYITRLRSGRTDRDWTVTFTLDDGSAALRTFMLAQPGAQLILGEAPAMRRLGTAAFLAVRQTGGDSLFVAVHHPYVGKPLVQKVERIPLRPDDGKAVALRVTLPNRVDTIICTTDNPPFPLRRTADGIALRGRFAHVARGQKSWLYLVDGEELSAGDQSLRRKLHFEGVIDRTWRVEAGDPFDAFQTRAALPTDGSLDGETIMVNLGGLLVQSFRISRIERRGNATLIHTPNEPGMTIRPGLVKLEYYPCWGVKGQARFTIAASAWKMAR